MNIQRMKDNIRGMKDNIRETIKIAMKEAKSKEEVVSIWLQDKRIGIPKEAKLRFCSGCRQNYYNGCGAKECWELRKARLCRRKIYRSLNSVTPDDTITLNCYTQEYH